MIGNNTPCLRGLRYPVELVLELLSAGMSSQDLLADYPDLEHDDILAALAYATKVLHIKRVELLAS